MKKALFSMMTLLLGVTAMAADLEQLTLSISTPGPDFYADGTPVPGYTLAECFPVFGDHLDFPVTWKGKGTDVSALAGKPIRIRFSLKDADLYAYQFVVK